MALDRWNSLSSAGLPFVVHKPALFVAGDEGFSDALAEQVLGQHEPGQHDIVLAATRSRSPRFAAGLRGLLRSATAHARRMNRSCSHA